MLPTPAATRYLSLRGFDYGIKPPLPLRGISPKGGEKTYRKVVFSPHRGECQQGEGGIIPIEVSSLEWQKAEGGLVQ
jgi:hypothetical protein